MTRVSVTTVSQQMRELEVEKENKRREMMGEFIPVKLLAGHRKLILKNGAQIPNFYSTSVSRQKP